MLIEKKINGWSFTTEEQNGLWHLVYDDDNNIVAFFESTKTTSTSVNLFVGTKEECDQYIIDHALVLPVSKSNSEPYQLKQQYNSRDLRPYLFYSRRQSENTFDQ